jgi:hypothetical protein
VGVTLLNSKWVLRALTTFQLATQSREPYPRRRFLSNANVKLEAACPLRGTLVLDFVCQQLCSSSRTGMYNLDTGLTLQGIIVYVVLTDYFFKT